MKASTRTAAALPLVLWLACAGIANASGTGASGEDHGTEQQTEAVGYGALDSRTQEAIDGLQKALEGAYPADVADEIAGLVSDAVAGGAGNLDEYRDKIAALLPGDGATDALDKLFGKLDGGDLGGLANAVGDFGNAAAQAAGDLGKGLGAALDSRTQEAIDGLQKALEGVYPAGVADEIASLVSDAIADGADKLDEYRDKLADLLPGDGAADALDQLIAKLGSGDLGGLADAVENIGNAAAQAASDLGKGLGDALDAGAQAVIDEIRDALGWSLPSDVADEIASLISDAIGAGKDKLDEYREKIGDLLPGDGAKDALDALFGMLDSVDPGGLADAVADLGKKAAVDYLTGVLIDLGLADGLPLEDIQKAAEALVNGAYDAGQSIVDALQQAVEEGLFGEGGLADILDKLGIDLSQISVDGLIDALEDAVADAWDTITTVGLEKLEEFASDQLDQWISSHPEIQKVFEILGIDGGSIIQGVKDVWGVLTGNGTLEEKFGQLVSWAQNKLCDMAQSALKYGLGKLAGWLSDIAHKWVSKALDWIAGVFAELFGLTVPTDAIQGFQAKLDQLAGNGIKKAMDYAQGAGSSLVDGFRSKDQSQGSGGGTKSVWQAGTP